MKTKTPLLHLVILIVLTTTAGFLFALTEDKVVLWNRLKTETTALAENQAKLLSLKESTPDLQKDLESWRKTLPSTEENVAEVAGLVESLAKQNNLGITLHFDDFPVVVDVGGQKFIGLGTDITLEGLFQGLNRFAYDFSRLPYFFKSDKLTIIKREMKKPGIKATFTGYLMMSESQK